MVPSLALILPDPEHSPLMRAVLVAGYLAAALCWLKAGLRAGTAHDRSSRRWWMLGAFLLLLLAANKAFDFRAQCEVLIRETAKANGWYERRQPVQFGLAIMLPVVAGLAGFWLLRTRACQFIRDHPLALTGWLLLFLYLALRQAQEWKPALDWLDSAQYHQWRPMVELAGIGFTIIAAVLGGRMKT